MADHPTQREEEDEEDDYLTMTFGDPKTTPSKSKPPAESSLQRTARLKKEALARAQPRSKAEIAAQAKKDQDIALATSLDASNKGAQMLARMGYAGGALGQMEGARTTPIELLVKDDRGGIGMESEKRKRVREAAEEAGVEEKKRKVGAEEFRVRQGVEREERRGEGVWWGGMKVLEGMEEGGARDAKEGEEGKVAKKDGRRLKDVNVLYRPLVKSRLDKERVRKMRYDLNNLLSTRNNDSDSDPEDHKDPAFSKMIDQLDNEDSELEEYEALGFADRVEKVVTELREKYRYCFWCKFQYPDTEMEGCPGVTEDEHG